MYGKGIDKEQDLLDVAMSQGIVTKSGAWYSMECRNNIAQGEAKMLELLREDRAFFEEIKNLIKE
jgi:recombination protein RecA